MSCARQLSSVFLEVYPDAGDLPLSTNSVQIPRSCFTLKGDIFRATVGANRSDVVSCPVGISPYWESLNQCRQYKIVLVTEYSSQWKSEPFIFNKFLTEVEGTKGYNSLCKCG